MKTIEWDNYGYDTYSTVSDDGIIELRETYKGKSRYELEVLYNEELLYTYLYSHIEKENRIRDTDEIISVIESYEKGDKLEIKEINEKLTKMYNYNCEWYREYPNND